MENGKKEKKEVCLQYLNEKKKKKRKGEACKGNGISDMKIKLRRLLI